ncbi:FecR family protein [Parapedobacter deserti]|uniref:FecR family protein n=1 Tax=Parapedobacter deserti TaxID=1912957 RepID=A0ABV7JPF3_9SPHI
MDDVLLTKYLLSESTEQEAAAVRNWIAAHPDNERHYMQLRAIWEASRALAGKRDLDENEAWERFVRRRDQPRASLKMGWVRIAAALLLVCSAALAGVFLFGAKRDGLFGSTYQTADATRTDTLADGSVITLNRFANLRFAQHPFKGKREVDLRSGEAYFEVKPNKNKPFVIQSGQVTVTVVGTSFHVRRNGNETQVTVESGKVKAAAPDKTVALGPGQTVTIDTRTGRFDEGVVKDQLHNYYVSKRFVLDNTPLWRIAEVLEHAYNVDIVIARRELRELPMTTTLGQGSLDDVLTVVAETLELTIERKGNQIIVK